MATLRLCSVQGCGKRHKARGFCDNHLGRYRRWGHPMGGQPNRGTTVQWLRDHVGHTGDACLTWPFSTNPLGYGCVTFDGRRRNASRVMCELAHGKPPTPDHEAAHSCGKGHEACVHPGHLSWKTHSGNQLDRHDHGTACRGDEQWMSRLTAADVKVIRASRRTFTQEELGNRFGVNRSTIAKIQRRERWGWLPD